MSSLEERLKEARAAFDKQPDAVDDTESGLADAGYAENTEDEATENESVQWDDADAENDTQPDTAGSTDSDADSDDTSAGESTDTHAAEQAGARERQRQVDIREYRKQARQLHGAEKRAAQYERELAEVRAGLEQLKRQGVELPKPKTEQELLDSLRDDGLDAAAELVERLQQQVRQEPAPPQTGLPVFYSEQEQAFFTQADALPNDHPMQQLAEWAWLAAPRQGNPKANATAAKKLALAQRLEAEMLRDPQYAQLDSESFLATVVRRVEVAGRQAATVPSPKPEPTYEPKAAKRTPHSLSAAAGVSGGGRSDGNDLLSRYRGATNKGAFMASLSSGDRDRLYDLIG